MLAGGGQCVDIVRVEPVEHSCDPFAEAVDCEEMSESFGSRGKPAGNRNTQAGQVSNHLSEGGVLAANGLHVLHAKLFELDDERLQAMLPCCSEAGHGQSIR